MSVENIRIDLEKFNYDLKTSDSDSYQPILNNINLKVNPGETLAIMGPSGAGKSSLLSALAGRIQKSSKVKTTGKVSYNKENLTPEQISKISGFVLQEDIFIDFLTVRETLEYSAQLVLQQPEYAQERIDELITAFGLEKCQNTLIGGKFCKGISGGEKKRTNICNELLSDPPVLFLDEPTSGLDSFTSEIVIAELKRLAKEQNKTIIFTIHQPNSQIFSMMDKLILLKEGNMVFYGKAEMAALHFSKLGLPCEEESNPADHFMYVLQSKVEGLHELLVKNCPDPEKEQILKIEKEKKLNLSLKEILTDLKSQTRSQTAQMKILVKRAFKIITRNPALTIIRLVTVLGLSFLFCSLYYQLDDRPTKISNIFNRVGALFFVTVTNFMPPMLAMLITFPIERAVFLKEYSNGYYKVWPYFLSKTVVELPLALFFPCLFTGIVYFIVGFNNEGMSHFWIMLGINLVQTITGTGIGMMFGCFFTNIELVINMAPVIVLPFMLLSGFYVSADSIPNQVSWLQFASPFKYVLEALMINEFKGKGFVPDPINTYSLDLGIFSCVGILMILGVVFRFAGYLGLCANTKYLT